MGGKAKRSAKINAPAVRFVQKRPCGSNGKPIKKTRGGRGRPYMGGAEQAARRFRQKNPDTRERVRPLRPSSETNRVASRDNMAALRKAFRFCSKTYGLTYSSAAGIPDKETLHDFLQQLVGVHCLCVCRELHESGEQHFHCSGRMDHKLETLDCHHFDFTNDDGVNFHPNIVKGGPAWLNYVMKGKDVITNYPSKRNVMAEALACSSTERALDHVMEHDASSYVRFGLGIENNLNRHFTRKSRARVPQWHGPYPAGRYPPDWNPATHALHLWGPPGSGKTCFAQHLLREHYGDCEYVKAHIESMRALSFTKPFVFDEAMFLLHDGATSREITDVVSGGVIHARYNAITIPPGIPRVFVSNQRWVFKNPDESVYGRRLIQYEMPFSCAIEEWRLYNPPQDLRPPPRPPTPEQPPPPPPGTPPSRGNSPPPPPPDVDDVDMVTDPDDIWPTIFERWEEASDDFARRPRPSQAPAIGAAPAAPMTPPRPMPATPHWSPGWSPLLPFDDLYEMDIDPFLQDETLVIDRDDL